jgi:Hemerythrin HHE cation binding domain
MRTTTRELSSSDARYAILSRHDELRGLVTETIRHADVARTSDRDCEPLRAHARELYQAFQMHMDFEERILGTALRDVIGWGAVLHAQIEEGHERQRATLASAMSALEPEGLSSISLVDSVRTVADSLLHDLTDEEKCLLNADLDAIAIDSRGG